MLTKSYGYGCAGRVDITGSLVNEACGTKFKEILELLVNDGVLEKFIKGDGKAWRPEYVAYDGVMNYRYGFPGEEGGAEDEYYNYYFECLMGPEELDQYIEEVRTLGKNAPEKMTGQRVSHDTEKSKCLIHKDTHGDFFYNGKRIEMTQGTISYKVFHALCEQADQHGFLSYEKIENFLVNSGIKGIEDVKERNKRITNAVGKLGLFKSARVGGELLKNETLDGRKLIEPVGGKGWKLNNPKI
jgi:hypothetical protein